mmetsp:Transcript_6265/g.9102  ORF Transcript_6265/g.9102 Transcript_6265/m.9102 type:complete len:434 (+) Transcript_6265:46-1347(+)
MAKGGDSSKHVLSQNNTGNDIFKVEGLQNLSQNDKNLAFTAFQQRMIEELDNFEKEREDALKPTLSTGLDYMAGILNWTFILSFWTAFPQHFWIIYILEVGILAPWKMSIMIKAKPLNEAFHYFELCWVFNILCTSCLLIFSLDALIDFGVTLPDVDTRKNIFWGFFGVACGPLYGAAYLLPFIALVPDSTRLNATLYTHIMPAMLFHTFLWSTEAITTSWPKIFELEFLQREGFSSSIVPSFFPEHFLSPFMFSNDGSLLSSALSTYMKWWVPYVIWQVTIGLDLPRKIRRTKGPDGKPLPPVYDTIFHFTMRGNNMCEKFGTFFWKRPVELSRAQIESNDYELRDFVMFTTLHVVQVNFTFFICTFPCSLHKYVHSLWLCALYLLIIWKGARKHRALLRQTAKRRVADLRKHLNSIQFGKGPPQCCPSSPI